MVQLVLDGSQNMVLKLKEVLTLNIQNAPSTIQSNFHGAHEPAQILWTAEALL